MISLWKVKLSLEKCAVARRRRPIGRLWTRLHNTEENRAKHSWYNTILREAAMHDQVVFFNITRMTPTTFEDLLLRLGTVQSLHKKDTKYRNCIPLGTKNIQISTQLHNIFCSIGARMALTLRFPATGDNLRSLGYAFRVGHSTATASVNNITAALVQVLKGDVLKKPSTEEWRTKANEFHKRWNWCCTISSQLLIRGMVMQVTVTAIGTAHYHRANGVKTSAKEKDQHAVSKT